MTCSSALSGRRPVQTQVVEESKATGSGSREYRPRPCTWIFLTDLVLGKFWRCGHAARRRLAQVSQTAQQCDKLRLPRRSGLLKDGRQLGSCRTELYAQAGCSVFDRFSARHELCESRFRRRQLEELLQQARRRCGESVEIFFVQRDGLADSLLLASARGEIRRLRTAELTSGTGFPCRRDRLCRQDIAAPFSSMLLIGHRKPHLSANLASTGVAGMTTQAQRAANAGATGCLIFWRISAQPAEDAATGPNALPSFRPKPRRKPYATRT